MITSAPRNSFHEVTNANSDDGHDRRPDRRHEDATEHLPAGAAVDDRGLLQLARHRLEAVAHDVDAERELDRRVNDGEADRRCWSASAWRT